MSQATLKIIHGFLGAGKTTYSNWLAAQTGDIRMNADEYCAEHFSKEIQEKNWDACFSKAVSCLYNHAEIYLQSGKSVILDFGFWDKKSRDYARGFSQKIAVDFQHIYLDIPDEIMLERIKKRVGTIANKNIDNFYVLKKLFEEPQIDEETIKVKHTEY